MCLVSDKGTLFLISNIFHLFKNLTLLKINLYVYLIDLPSDWNKIGFGGGGGGG